MEKHSHDAVYYGVVNLLDNANIVGAVDVWRCRICRKLFCEDKRWGLTELVSYVGFPELAEDERWAVLVCRTSAGLTWSLVAAKPGKTLPHSCTKELVCDVNVDTDFSVHSISFIEGRGNHRLYLLDDYINRELEIGYEGIENVETRR